MKNEPAKIIGLAVFFLVMGIMIGYNIRAQQDATMRIVDTETETVITNER